LDDARQDVDVIQLVLDEEGYRALQPLLGNRVPLVGSLYASFTAHHHARLLLSNPKIKPQGSRYGKSYANFAS